MPLAFAKSGGLAYVSVKSAMPDQIPFSWIDVCMRERQNFVVEFKSSRRQAKKPPASIWGDTDLKAIARQVEYDLPTADRRSEAGPVVQGSAPMAAEPASEIPQRIDMPNNELPAAGFSDPAASELPMPEIGAARHAAEAVDPPLVPVVVSAPEEADHSTPVGQESTSKRSKPAKKTPPTIRPAVQTQQASFEDLDALDTENRRLRALWRSRLQTENAQLKEMLARLPSA